MKPNDFELRLASLIKTFRKINGYKQINISKGSQILESSLCKIEKGQQVISLRQLRAIAEYLQISYIQILFLAEGDQLKNLKFKPLSVILLEYFLLLQGRGEDVGFTKEEIETLMEKIRKCHS